MGDYKSKLKSFNPKQIALLQKKIEELLPVQSNNVDTKKRLISYITSDDKDIDIEDLKSNLQKKLPNYMVPDAIIKLDELNYLSNGKIDKKELPKQTRVKLQKTLFDDKTTATEQTIIAVWEEVLNIKPVTINDNFFELGGDSILSIQITSRLRKEGLLLKANTLFDHQTIKELARVVKHEKKDNIKELLIEIWEEVLNIKPITINDNFFELGGDSILSIQIIARLRRNGYTIKANDLFNYQTIKELSTFVKKDKSEVLSNAYNGELILTPIQHWFFELHKNSPHFWNQICEVDIPQTFSNQNLEHIILKLIETHDGLRQGFYKKNNKWKSRILKLKDFKAVFTVDISNLKEENIENQIENEIYEHQNKYEIVNNYLFRGLLINVNKTKPKKLFLIAHHLIIDVISWQVIKNDFVELYNQTNTDQPLHLNKNSSSYTNYNNSFIQLTNSSNLNENLDYWKTKVNANKTFSVDYKGDLPILETDIDTIKFQFEDTLTNNILSNSKNTSNLSAEEVLIATLTKTICEWSNLQEINVLKENHGRQTEDENLDFSETVGWLTKIYPIKVSYGNTKDLKTFILEIKDNLRNIPNNGLDYGILRYLTEDESIKQSLNHSIPIVFNYLGKKENSENKYDLVIKNKLTNTRSNLSERNYFFEINASIQSNILELTWSYSKKCHSSKTITHLLTQFEKNLEEIVRFCSKLDNSIYSASDFPDSDLDNDDLNELLSQL